MKNCRNCYYFYKHYLKDEKCKVKEVTGCGHCVNLKVQIRTFNKHFRLGTACDHWVNGEKQEEEKKKNLHTTLTDIANRLEELRKVIED